MTTSSQKNPTSHLNLPEDLAGGVDVPEGDIMSIPTAGPARPVPTRNSREQCPTCRCFLPVRKTPTACPRCGQPLNSGASTRPRPPKPAERVRLANYEAEIAYRISQDVQAKWQGCSIAEVWPCDIALIINKTLDHLVDLEQKRAAA